MQLCRRHVCSMQPKRESVGDSGEPQCQICCGFDEQQGEKAVPFLLKEKRALNFQLLLPPRPKKGRPAARQQGDLFRGCGAAGTAAHSTSAGLVVGTSSCQYILESASCLFDKFFMSN